MRNNVTRETSKGLKTQIALGNLATGSQNATGSIALECLSLCSVLGQESGYQFYQNADYISVGSKDVTKNLEAP